MNEFQNRAKDLIFKIDYDLAKEIEEDEDWVGSVIFKSVLEALERAYEDGFNDGIEQFNRTF